MLAAALALLLRGSGADAGWPNCMMKVGGVASSCPLAAPPEPAHSWVAGSKGSLQLDLPIAGVQGVPGDEVNIVLHYASASDNQGTYGSPLVMDVRHEDIEACARDPFWQPTHWRSGEIHLTEVTGGPPGADFRVGFGLREQQFDTSGNPIEMEACNSFRSWPMPAPPTAPSSFQFGELGCGGHGCTSARRFTMSFPLKLDGTQRNFSRIPAAGDCPPDGPGDRIVAPDAALYAALPGLTMTVGGGTPSAAHHDYGYGDGSGCQEGEPIYIEKQKDPSIAKMGRNWSHGLAWHITEYPWTHEGVPGVIVVLHDPRGGRREFFSTGTLGSKAEAVPDNGCNCQDSELYYTARQAVGDQPAFLAWELFDRRDGSRMVFHRSLLSEVPPGRLVRMEGLVGRNAVTLAYSGSAGELTTVRDASGFTYTFGYAGLAADRRLTSITLPGGRVCMLDYDQGRVARFFDAVLSPAHPTGPAWTFEYGGSFSLHPQFADITRATTPDGEVHKYSYWDFGTKAGKIYEAQILRPDGSVAHGYRYNYSEADYNSGASTAGLGYWSETSPFDVATAPILRQEYTFDGRLTASMQICYLNCEPATYQVMKNTIEYDEFYRPKVITRFPANTREDDVGVERSKVCLDYDSAGNVKRVRGPVCVQIPGDLQESWTSGADCEDDIDAESNADGVVCPAEVSRWHPTPAPFFPSSLTGGTYFPLGEITPASEANFGSGGNHSFKQFKFWWNLDPPGLSPNPPGTLRYICPAHTYGTVPWDADSECDMFQWESVAGPSGDVVRLASRTDGAGKTWTYSYTPQHLLQSIVEPFPLPPQAPYTTSFGHDSATGFLQSVTVSVVTLSDGDPITLVDGYRLT